MVHKYSFSVSGDSFYPAKVIGKTKGELVIESYFSPGDSKGLPGISDQYEYGCVSFWHHKKFSTENQIVAYEKDFVEFIEENYQLFTEHGASDFEIYLEIYFDGGQCNFEIFDKAFLRQLANFNVALPISIYVLKESEIKQWENEIQLLWNEH